MDYNKELLDSPNSVHNEHEYNPNIHAATDNTSDPEYHCPFSILEEEEEVQPSQNHYFTNDLRDYAFDSGSDSDSYFDNDGDNDTLYYYEDNPASEEAIESMPLINYDKQGEEEMCVVCQDALEEGEEVRLMPCDHIFHNQCILPWLQRRCYCPLCRYEMPQADSNPNPNANLNPNSNPDPNPIPNPSSHNVLMNRLAHYRRLVPLDILTWPIYPFDYEGWYRSMRELIDETIGELLEVQPTFDTPRLGIGNSVPHWIPDYNDVDEIPLDDCWFESMVALEKRKRSKSRKERKNLFARISFSWRRRKSAINNENWSHNMILRSNAIIKSQPNMYSFFLFL